MLSISRPRVGFRVVALPVMALLFCGVSRAQPAGIPARSVPLALPSAIAFDAAGDLFVAEMRGNTIRKVDPSGVSTLVAGDGTQGFSGDGGPATLAQLDSPQGVAVDAAGDVFVSDSGNDRIRRIDAATGTIMTVAGSGRRGFGGDGGPPLAASFASPRAICLDASGTQMYVADARNHRIRHVDLSAGRIETYAGGGGQGFAGDGGPATVAALDTPESVAMDTLGNLFVADTQNGRIRKVAAGTRVITTVAAGAGLGLPRGVTVDAQGNVYVAEAGRSRVVRVSAAEGTVSVVAGGGAQGFAGDGGAAVSALLDGPRAAALSPAGLVTFADAGNERVRQLLATPSETTPIQTIAGLGVTLPGVFTLSAPAVVAYGGGSVSATLQTGGAASGQVTFFDGSSAIGTVNLAGNVAALSLAGMPAGVHRLMATYAGDLSHGSAQTPVLSVTVAPLTLQVTANPATMVYGTAVPTLGGTVSGLLPQDAAAVTVTFASTASALAPAGNYPITASMSGVASGNYVLQVAGANLVVGQAGTSASLKNASADGSFTGVLQAQVSSSTSGTPTGMVSLLDGGALLERGTLSGGAAMFSVTTLASGTHALSVSYGGDQDFIASVSPAVTAVVAPVASADFSMAAVTQGSQLLSSGGSVAYTVTVQMTGGGLSSPVNLAATGLPAFTTASFSPAYIPPGTTGSATTVLTISSGSSVATKGSGGLGAMVMAGSLPMLGLLVRRRRRWAVLLVFVVVLPMVGCGDRVYPNTNAASAPKSYTVTVTGTATSASGATLQHSAVVTLQM